MTPKPLQKGCWPDGTGGAKTIYFGPEPHRHVAGGNVPVLPVELVEGLVEALSFYADKENYEEWVPGEAHVERIQDAVPPNDTEREWEPDNGDRARSALASYRQAMGIEAALDKAAPDGGGG